MAIKSTPSFLINRLFSLSGLVVWACGLLLIQKGLKPFFSFQVSSVSIPQGVLFLILIFHFFYGLSWLQGIYLNKLFGAGVYYFFKRLTFLLGFFYLILIAFAAHPMLGPMIHENLTWLYIHGILLTAFLIYGYAGLADFFWDWGVMTERKSWKNLFLYLAIPFFGVSLYLLGQSHFNWMKGISP